MSHTFVVGPLEWNVATEVPSKLFKAYYTIKEATDAVKKLTKTQGRKFICIAARDVICSSTWVTDGFSKTAIKNYHALMAQKTKNIAINNGKNNNKKKVGVDNKISTDNEPAKQASNSPPPPPPPIPETTDYIKLLTSPEGSTAYQETIHRFTNTQKAMGIMNELVKKTCEQIDHAANTNATHAKKRSEFQFLLHVDSTGFCWSSFDKTNFRCTNQYEPSSVSYNNTPTSTNSTFTKLHHALNALISIHLFMNKCISSKLKSSAQLCKFNINIITNNVDTFNYCLYFSKNYFKQSTHGSNNNKDKDKGHCCCHRHYRYNRNHHHKNPRQPQKRSARFATRTILSPIRLFPSTNSTLF